METVIPQRPFGLDRNYNDSYPNRPAGPEALRRVAHSRAGTHDNGSGIANQRPPLFCGISQLDYAAIFAGARVRKFSRGEMLHNQGDSVQRILLITSGLVKISQIGQHGAEVIFGLDVAGDVLGAEGLFTTGNHSTRAQAFRDCQAFAWEIPNIKARSDCFPVVQQNAFRILDGYRVELQQRFLELATERVGPRVARQLLRLMEKIGRPVGGAVEIGLSREDIALMTGTTLFTVSRLFSSWRRLGLVKLRRESVTVCDVKQLFALSEEC